MQGSPRYCKNCGCRCHCLTTECKTCVNDVCYRCDCDLAYLNRDTTEPEPITGDIYSKEPYYVGLP